MGNQDVADIVWPRLCSGMPLEQIGSELLHACCARSSYSGQPMSEGTDNETVVLVKLPAAPGDLALAQRVQIEGLVSDARQRFNGQAGIIERPGMDGRYEVRLDSGDVKAFKAVNLCA